MTAKVILGAGWCLATTLDVSYLTLAVNLRVGSGPALILETMPPHPTYLTVAS